MDGNGSVLVDSSTWIDFLTGQAEAVGLLTGLIQGHRVVVCGTITQEVLQGSRDAKALARLEREMSIWPYEAEQAEDFVEAARTYAALRWKGVTVPASDCLIAAVARRCGMRIASTDPHFASIPDVRLVQP
jgi:predicted nucleic acid-binding protein